MDGKVNTFFVALSVVAGAFLLVVALVVVSNSGASSAPRAEAAKGESPKRKAFGSSPSARDSGLITLRGNPLDRLCPAYRIYSDYERDVVAADAKYLGRQVEMDVWGTVRKDRRGHYRLNVWVNGSLVGEEYGNLVVVRIRDSAAASFAKVSPGSNTKECVVRGVCRGLVDVEDNQQARAVLIMDAVLVEP